VAFEIKGSEFAFVKLEEWKPCRNGSLHLEFKTTFENVLIFYTDDNFVIKKTAKYAKVEINSFTQYILNSE
jgi:hypothetical protein